MGVASGYYASTTTALLTMAAPAPCAAPARLAARCGTPSRAEGGVAARCSAGSGCSIPADTPHRTTRLAQRLSRPRRTASSHRALGPRPRAQGVAGPPLRGKVHAGTRVAACAACTAACSAFSACCACGVGFHNCALDPWAHRRRGPWSVACIFGSGCFSNPGGPGIRLVAGGAAAWRQAAGGSWRMPRALPPGGG